MVSITLPVFAGMVPSVDKHLLDSKNGQYVEDAWLYSGALDGLPLRSDVHTLDNTTAKVAFRLPLNEADPSYLFDSYWVEFENGDTDFIKAPVLGDSYDRFYWTSTSQEPMYNTRARIIAGDPPWLLGIPQPGDLDVVAAGGISATLVSRTYIATLVSDYGEEGPASNPFLVENAKIDDTFTITLPAVAADDLGVDRNIKKIRLYRTVVSTVGTVTYYLVDEVDALVTTQVIVDTATDAVISSNAILDSIAWVGPPSLDGMVVMPNGIVAGFEDNQLWFSEPYRPHAWPVAYGLTVEYDIIGLAVIGQTLVICTKGNPMTASGVHPSVITTSKMAAFEPCASKGSIVATEMGVFYTSLNGLIQVMSGLAQNVTSQFISKDKWSTIVNRAKVNAARLGNAYYAYGSAVSETFQEDAFQQDAVQTQDITGANVGFMIDTTNPAMGFQFLEDDIIIDSLKNDAWSSELLVVRDGVVTWMDQREGYPRDTFTWKSKVFQVPSVKNFAAFKMWFDASGTEPAGAQLASLLNPVTGVCTDIPFDTDTQYGVVRVYADSNLIAAYEFRTPGELFRLPSGFEATFWEIEFEGRVRIKSFQMATSVKELSSV